MKLPSDRSEEFLDSTPPSAPTWAECECFCIRDYAGTWGAPCGWRGRWRDTIPVEAGRSACCPRCGGATLMALPGHENEPPHA
jgi:hypothetical protein